MKDFIRFLIVFLASSVSNTRTLNEPAVEQKESVLSAMVPLLEADAAMVNARKDFMTPANPLIR